MLDKIAEYAKLDHRLRREFILDALISLGVDPIRQELSYNGSRLMNIGGYYGKPDDLPISAFSAHYDKTPEGDGVLDNGAAVIEILSTLEKMVSRESRKAFGILFFDGEEMGLIGSGKYANNPFLNLSEVYNLDVTGRGDAILIASASYDLSWRECVHNSAEMNRRIEIACRNLNIPSFRAKTPPSDNVALNLAGIKSTVFSTVSHDLGLLWESHGGPTERVLEGLDINGPNDTLDKIEASTLEMVRAILLEIIQNHGKV